MNRVHVVNMVHPSTAAERRRQERRDARAAELLDAAGALLREEGVGALTMARVARRAGVAVGGIYRYFPSKEALLAALQVRAVGAFDARLAAAMARADGPVSALRAAGRAWFAFAASDPERFRLLDASLSDPSPNLPDDHARQVDEALAPVLGRVRHALDSAVREGSLAPGDAALRTHALWAAVHGAAHLRKRARLGAPPAEQVRDLAVDALLRAWSSEPVPGR